MISINKDTPISLGLVLVIIGGGMALSKAYSTLDANNREVLMRLERIEHSVNSERRWTRENMEDWVRDAEELLQTNLPRVEEYVEKD